MNLPTDTKMAIDGQSETSNMVDRTFTQTIVNTDGSTIIAITSAKKMMEDFLIAKQEYETLSAAAREARTLADKAERKMSDARAAVMDFLSE